MPEEPKNDEQIDTLTEKIEVRVKNRLLTHFFGRDNTISDEVKREFESSIDELNT